MSMYCFQNVAVELPAGGCASWTLDDCSRIPWVRWSVGDLRVDSDSHSIVFTPAPGGASGLAAKPLGVLTGAVALDPAKVNKAEPTKKEDVPPRAPPSAGLSRSESFRSRSRSPKRGNSQDFVITTNDAVHGLFQLKFSSCDADKFRKVVHSAQKRFASRQAPVAELRKSVVDKRSSEETSRLMEHVAEQHSGLTPCVFSGAELYGPEPSGAEGTEVLLGAGVVALLDPAGDGRVGTYEFLFYDDSGLRFRMAITSRVKLVQEHEDPSFSSRLSMTRRQSMARPGVVSFNIEVDGQIVLAITFDKETEAASFRRDFAVRQRLMTLSLKTSRSLLALDSLREEFDMLKARGLFATLRHCAFHALLLLAVLVVFHAGWIYYVDPHRTIWGALQTSFNSTVAWIGMGKEIVSGVAGQLCQVVVPAPTCEPAEQWLEEFPLAKD